jgi:carbon storage regulator
MLVLSRKRDESIVLSFELATAEELAALRGQTIQITLVDLRGDKVRLGVVAPESVRIDRFELYRQMQREKALAQK